MYWDPKSKEAQDITRKNIDGNRRMMRRYFLRRKYEEQGKDYRAELDSKADPRIKSLKKQIVSEYQKQNKGISRKQAEIDAMTKSQFGRQFSRMFYTNDDPVDEIINRINRRRVHKGLAKYKVGGHASSGHSGG